MSTREISLIKDLETSYFAYATEVIRDRALPRVEDGLLPVQRRILYAMHAMGLRHTSPYKKSARVVGEVLGKFHPHGDSSVYGSMVRLAQEFSMWAPLVDGQGNFGSIDGDSPAAMRYTEARLSPIAQSLLQDINRDAVDWTENFDGSLQEPVILPAVLPNLLVNGASGIAVGMSTNMPPHNLGEVCRALVFMAQNWKKREKITVDDLMKFVPGPDFPTGGVAYRYRADTSRNGDGPETVDTIRDAYLDGRGKIVTQARVAIEEISGGKSNIVVTELPYAVQKSTVLEKIAREVNSGRIEGVSDLRDESDYEGMRMVVEVMRGYDPRDTLEQLLTYTQLRETFGVISRALVVDDEGQVHPEMLSLRDILDHFISHRLTVIIRRTKHELAQREARLHIIEGLLRALDMVDEVVTAIRKSRSKDTARKNLQRTPFNFSDEQAKAIVAMPLGNLASLEINALKKEGREVWNRIKHLKELLKSETKRLEVVVEETEALQEFTVPRRTVILDSEDQVAGASITTESDLVRPDGPQIVALTTKGVLRSNKSGFSYRVSPGVSSRAVESHLAYTLAQPEDRVLLISNQGRGWVAEVGRVPDKAAPGEMGLGKHEFIVGSGIIAPDRFVVIGTRQGKIKRIKVEDLALTEASWAAVIGLDKEDEALFAGIGSDAATLMFFTAGGKAVHFAANTVNPKATPTAKGMAGMKVATDDSIVAGVIIEPDKTAQVVIVSETGHIKRIPLQEFPIKGRGTQGVQSLDISKVTGNVVAATVGSGNLKYVDVVSGHGLRCRLAAGKVPRANRRQRGKQLVKFGPDDVISTVACW